RAACSPDPPAPPPPSPARPGPARLPGPPDRARRRPSAPRHPHTPHHSPCPGCLITTALSPACHHSRLRRRCRARAEVPKFHHRNTMSDMSTGNDKVVVTRSMSLDGFIAGPGRAMDWVFDFVAPDEFPEIAAATGAMLNGRRTYEVGNRMEADKPGSARTDLEPVSGTRSGTVTILRFRVRK